MTKLATTILWAVLVVVVIGGLWYVAGLSLESSDSALPTSATYEPLVPSARVVDVAGDMGAITRVKLTPDNQLMLVATLTGDVWALTKDSTGWVRQERPFYQLDHGMDTAGENGLTGLIVSSDYARTQSIFLTYTQKQPSGRGQNQILRLKVVRQDDAYVGMEPVIIFRGNTPVLGAHQIQGGDGLMIEDKPHLLFAVGEGYQEHHARDITKEAGKLILIQEDGSSPLGMRPYPEFPKIQAIGIRNVYDVVVDPVNKDWVYLTHNGPSANDLIMHVPVLDGRQYDFNWQNENNPASLLKPTVDGIEAMEYVIRVWEVTLSPTDILADRSGAVYFNIFGSSRYEGREVVKGELRNGQWQWQVVARRKAGLDGGGLLGLARGADGVLYFGDLYDGVVYGLASR